MSNINLPKLDQNVAKTYYSPSAYVYWHGGEYGYFCNEFGVDRIHPSIYSVHGIDYDEILRNHALGTKTEEQCFLDFYGLDQTWQAARHTDGKLYAFRNTVNGREYAPGDKTQISTKGHDSLAHFITFASHGLELILQGKTDLTYNSIHRGGDNIRHFLDDLVPEEIELGTYRTKVGDLNNMKGVKTYGTDPNAYDVIVWDGITSTPSEPLFGYQPFETQHIHSAMALTSTEKSNKTLRSGRPYLQFSESYWSDGGIWLENKRICRIVDLGHRFNKINLSFSAKSMSQDFTNIHIRVKQIVRGVSHIIGEAKFTSNRYNGNTFRNVEIPITKLAHGSFFVELTTFAGTDIYGAEAYPPRINRSLPIGLISCKVTAIRDVAMAYIIPPGRKLHDVLATEQARMNRTDNIRVWHFFPGNNQQYLASSSFEVPIEKVYGLGSYNSGMLYQPKYELAPPIDQFDESPLGMRSIDTSLDSSGKYAHDGYDYYSRTGLFLTKAEPRITQKHLPYNQIPYAGVPHPAEPQGVKKL